MTHTIRITRTTGTRDHRWLIVAGAVFFLFAQTFLLVAEPADETTESLSPAERGYRNLTTKRYDSPLLSAELFAEMWKVWPEDLRSRAENASPEERRRMSFSRYGFVEAAERPGAAPANVADPGDGQWALNCLSCHQGKVAGKVIPGVGNTHFAFQTFAQDLVALKRFRGEEPTSGQVGLSLAALGRTNGTTNAQGFSITLVALRDKHLNQLPNASFPRVMNYDLDAPPFWNVKHKTRLYIDGFPEKSHRVIMQFALNLGNSGETFRNWENDFKDVLTWIESIEPPAYPWTIDRELAARGKTTFEENCSHCHGTYGKDGEYPERMVEIADIGTDPLRLYGMPVTHRQFFKDSWFGEYGKRTVVERPKGYIAPPLNGVWASAPYFHNGSVPTLWYVLHPESRPKIWQRTEDGYDTEKVGLEIKTFDTLPEAAKKRPDERRRYFETRFPGKGAQGHLYPNELSEDEKRAVLEYLKSL